MNASVDYFFSMVSPWAYIGHDALHDMAARHGAELVYRPVALMEVFERTDTPTLPNRHPTRKDYRMVELQRWREKRGLSYHLQPAHWPFPAATADRMVIAATQAGSDPAGFMRAVFAAIWEQNDDVTPDDALVRLADGAGLDGAALLEAAGSSVVETAYAANTDALVALGGFGSPVYVLNGELFWGQDRIDLLEDAIASGRAPFHPVA